MTRLTSIRAPKRPVATGRPRAVPAWRTRGDADRAGVSGTGDGDGGEKLGVRGGGGDREGVIFRILDLDDEVRGVARQGDEIREAREGRFSDDQVEGSA